MPEPTADPTTDPVTDPAADPAPVTDPAPGDPADDGKDPRVTRANSEAAKYRTERNALQAQLDAATKAQTDQMAALAKALGVAPADEVDPAAQVGTLTTQVETLTGENARLKGELLVHTLAPDAGANPVLLLDSRTFTDALAKIDPSAEGYQTAVAEAIKSAVETNQTFRAAGQVPSAGGAETAGQGAGSGAVVTAEQFEAMGVGARQELFSTNPTLYRELAAGIR